jgi:hypothetical protein
MGQVINANNLSSWTASGTVTKDCIVVSNAAGVVLIGAEANDENVTGVAQDTVADGEAVAVAGNGSIVWVTAGAAITYGAPLIVGDSSGRAIVCPDAAETIYNVLGYARGTCSNAGEKVSVLISIHSRTIPAA